MTSSGVAPDRWAKKARDWARALFWLLLQFFDSEYPGYARVGEGRNSLGIEKLDVQRTEPIVDSILCLSPSGELPQPTTTSDIITTLSATSTFFIDPPLIV